MHNHNHLQQAITFLISRTPTQIIKASAYYDEKCIDLAQKTNVIFPLAFVLHSLSSLPSQYETKEVQIWAKKAVVFIRKQSSGRYSFNYWIRSTAIAKQSPLPDDLDDTAFCLSALQKSGQEIDERYFMKMLQLEKRPGGPYKTWYVNPESDNEKKWQDIDPAVNANLLYFTTLFGIKLPTTRAYVLTKLRSGSYASPYGPYDLIFLLHVARYTYISQDMTAQRLLKQTLATYTYARLKPIEKLLYCIVSSYIGETISSQRMNYIYSLQKDDGSLPEMAVWYDMAHAKKKTFAASRSMSTALFVELLAARITENTKENVIHPEINKALTRQTKIIEEELERSPFKKIVKKTFPKQRSAKALTVPIMVALDVKQLLTLNDRKIIDDLSVAIYFGWLGYTIIDNILDGQTKKDLFPIATTLIQLSSKYYHRIFIRKPLLEEPLMRALQETDANYMWEMKHLRFTQKEISTIHKKRLSYSYIQKRMEPYLIALSFIPYLLEKRKTSQQSLYNFFRSQVIIDQLNDDAHDWKEDMNAGILTYVLWLLLRKHTKGIQHSTTFWKYTIDEVIDICEKEKTTAQKALAQIKPKETFMQKILDKTYAPIDLAQKEKEKGERILKRLS